MVFRVEKTKNYTVMSNRHLREKEMSLKAKGLLSWMLSNNDDWDYSIEGIVASCKEGEIAIKSILKELQELGYIEIKKCSSSKGNPRFHYEYIIYEEPHPEGCFAALDNPALDDPALQNIGQRNTKARSTKKEIKKKDNSKKPNLYDQCFEEIKNFTNDSAIQNALEGYLRVRIKEGLTVRGWKGILTNFSERVDPKNYINAIEYSTQKNYRGIFNAPEERRQPRKQFNDQINRDGRYDNENHSRTEVAF